MPLHPTLATIRRNLPGVARSLGFQARVTSAYRSTKKQAWLYDRYLRGLQPYPVAPPGTSDHEYGLALDVVSTNPDKLVALLTSAGLYWAGPSDPVHFSLAARKSQARGIKAAFESWKEGPGASIPPAVTMIPGIGGAFGFFSDPLAYLKDKGETLLSVILGPF